MCLSISLQASTPVDVSHLCTGDPTTDVDKAKFNRAEAFEQRRPKQYNNEPFATTTIGSFPQTPGLPSGLLCYWPASPCIFVHGSTRAAASSSALCIGVHCHVLCCHLFTSSLTSPSYER